MKLRYDYPINTNEPSGWYVPNSVRLSDVVPEYRNSGGGVLKEQLCKDVNDAINRAISICESKLTETKVHIKKLEKLKIS